MDVAAVVSNHPDLKPLADWHQIPYYHFPLDPNDKPSQERKVWQVIEESGAEVTVGELPALRCDSSQLVQVFQNLIGNAIKFSRPDYAPVVHVEATREGAAWEFSVADNGIGIEPKYFERIFQMFQRLHTRQEYEGTGIGLALCRKIVERHGGRIRVESIPHQGTMFFFTIPDVAGPAARKEDRG